MSRPATRPHALYVASTVEASPRDAQAGKTRLSHGDVVRSVEEAGFVAVDQLTATAAVSGYLKLKSLETSYRKKIDELVKDQGQMQVFLEECNVGLMRKCAGALITPKAGHGAHAASRIAQERHFVILDLPAVDGESLQAALSQARSRLENAAARGASRKKPAAGKTKGLATDATDELIRSVLPGAVNTVWKAINSQA